MSDKKLIKIMTIGVVAIFLAYFVVRGITIYNTGRDFTDTCEWADFLNGMEVNEALFISDNPDVITVTNAEYRDGKLFLTLHGSKSGNASIEYTDEDGNCLYLPYKVLPTGIIINMSTDNFQSYRLFFAYATAVFFLFALLLFYSFFVSYKKIRYSYISIFSLGLGLWNLVQTAIMVDQLLRGANMCSIYNEMRLAPLKFIAYTFPLLVILGVVLAISNILLIIREGFKKKNILGIFCAILLIGGAGLAYYLQLVVPSGNEKTARIISAVISIYWTGYAVFECFLWGSVICGSLSAKHKPDYDKDYIIILGCKIRKDGTLYPLIRGRVDTAIDFYKKQLAITGKKAKFIPSGGKGRDEIMSEAEAMRNYLVEQGIDEQDIVIEKNSKNTMENMRNSFELMEEGSKAVFSTTNFHVFRSGIISRQQGGNPDGMGCKTKFYFWPNAYIRETMGMIVYTKWTLLVLFAIVAAYISYIQITL